MGLGKSNQCKNTDYFFDNMISFPFHVWMSDKEFNYLLQSTVKSLNILRNKILNKFNFDENKTPPCPGLA